VLNNPKFYIYPCIAGTSLKNTGKFGKFDLFLPIPVKKIYVVKINTKDANIRENTLFKFDLTLLIYLF
jgi:hypothetical protein